MLFNFSTIAIRAQGLFLALCSSEHCQCSGTICSVEDIIRNSWRGQMQSKTCALPSFLSLWTETCFFLFNILCLGFVSSGTCSSDLLMFAINLHSYTTIYKFSIHGPCPFVLFLTSLCIFFFVYPCKYVSISHLRSKSIFHFFIYCHFILQNGWTKHSHLQALLHFQTPLTNLMNNFYSSILCKYLVFLITSWGSITICCLLAIHPGLKSYSICSSEGPGGR